MKKQILYVCLLACFAFASCSNNWSNVIPKSTFDASFPKVNKDLTQILGNEIYIKRGKDTTRFNISDDGKHNLITDKNGDTIFCGTVSKFRGLYYFSQQLNDTSYLIYAVKLKGNYLYGLNAPWYEGILIDHSIEKGEYKDMVKRISADGKVIRLHPDKKEMKKLYAMIMDSLPPDTLLSVPVKMSDRVKIDTVSITQEIDPDDFEMFSKVYPNPATDELNIELQQKENVKYTLSDITGKAVANGELNDSVNKVNVNALQNGIYVLTLVKADGKGEESVKIIKK
jgi:Secretion system C-terminal sorting domain